jgi:glutathione S-transferase
MTLQLHDLAGQDDARRISPFCWRVRLALAHKGLPVETLPWRMVEKDAIAVSGQGKVPVLRDGAVVVSDSWAIFEYLDDSYADRPALFAGGVAARPAYGLIRSWADGELLPLVARTIMVEFFDHLHEMDRAFFRETREAMFGTTIEKLCLGREDRVVDFRARLAPLRRQLGEAPFAAGSAPGLADYIIFSIFMWSRSVSDFALVERDDPVAGWVERMLDAHDGLARSAPGYEVAL